MPSDKNALLALVSNLYPDNSSGLVTPAKLRQGLQEMINSDLNLEELTTQEVLGLILYTSIAMKTGLADPAYQEAIVFYDDTEKALSYFNDEADITVNTGQQVIFKVLNNTGAIIQAGSTITIDGAVAGIPTAIKSIATSAITARSIGVMPHEMAIGATGYVSYIGKVKGIDTSAWLAGDALYVSDVTAGQLTNVSPRVSSLVGVVLVSDATEGQILVGPEGVIEQTAIAQSSTGAAHTQALTSTPVPAEGFSNAPFAKNIVVTSTSSNGSFRSAFTPISAPLSGFYEVNFMLTGESSSNEIVIAELYKNGVALGLIGKVDFTNNTIDEGTVILNGFTEAVLTEADTLEVYLYTQGGATSFTVANAVFNIKRLGGQ